MPAPALVLVRPGSVEAPKSVVGCSKQSMAREGCF
ncbi:hypothetical protein IEO21_04704 [Rhodonia placenta]|uniref:Uncharacterized protein n=1 Tax=Rhodonia placenta TaxID=104341 RepID=A0A8H7P3P0_9APHY|nr:hypothetical protein IEO21_04704 [Postia placenta]